MEQNDYRKKGDEVWFEYHCWESDESSDAELWHHSHQKVTVLSLLERGYGKTFIERAELGHPAMYRILFEDGSTGCAFEDELLDSKGEFCREDPPERHSGSLF